MATSLFAEQELPDIQERFMRIAKIEESSTTEWSSSTEFSSDKEPRYRIQSVSIKVENEDEYTFYVSMVFTLPEAKVSKKKKW